MSDTLQKLFEDAHQARTQHRLDDAKSMLAEAVIVARENNQPLELARGLTALGRIERDLKSTGSARKNYEEAAEIYRSQGEELRLAHCIRHVGDIYLEDRQLAAAEACYVEALKIYRANANTAPLELANTLRGFALLRQELGEREEAKQLWMEAGKLYDAVNVKAGVAESTRRIAQLS